MGIWLALGCGGVVAARCHLQHRASGLDTEFVAMLVDERDNIIDARVNSAWERYADALRKDALAAQFTVRLLKRPHPRRVAR